MSRVVSDFGFFLERDSNNMIIELNGKAKKYCVLKFFPFTSDRKASSVVVQDEEGKIFVFVKGADSSLINMSSN